MRRTYRDSFHWRRNRRYQVIMEQEREAQKNNPRPVIERSRPVTMADINTSRWDYDEDRWLRDASGWFGHGDNGHWLMTEILTSRSFASLGSMVDALAEQGFEHLLMFDMTVKDRWGTSHRMETSEAWLDGIAYELCDHSLHDWTSFLLTETYYGREVGYMLGFATMSAKDAIFLLMACPDDLLMRRVEVEKA